MRKINETNRRRRGRKRKAPNRNTASYNIEKRRRKIIRRQQRREKLESIDWKGEINSRIQLLPVIGKWTIKIAVICVLAFAYVWYFGQKVSTVGDSMNPVLSNGDVVLVNRILYNATVPKRGDIIVFKPRGNQNSHYYIKRIVGLPDETVEIVDNSVFINGEKLTEDYDTTEISDAGTAFDEIKLGPDEYFVLGDNRQNSEDSRDANVGNVKRSYIYGKAWFVASPRKHFGFIHE